MNKKEERFLRTLHYRLFHSEERGKQLRCQHPEEENEAIRNDQSITECHIQSKILKGIIEDFLTHCR